MKVKNIMFFGFAAAILSAASANAAVTHPTTTNYGATDKTITSDSRKIVTSKAYVDDNTNKLAQDIRNISIPGAVADLSDAASYELVENKVTSMSSSSTDTQYPSAKAVYDAIQEVADDVSGIAVNNNEMEIKVNNTRVGAFTANQNTDTSINITVPTTVAQLTDASSYATVTYVDTQDALDEKIANKLQQGGSETSTITASSTDTQYPSARNVYKLVDEKVSAVPAAGNAELDIQVNGASVGTFTANATTDSSINITVPTTVAQLTDSSDYATVTYVNTQDALDEKIANKVTSMSSSSTDVQYPSAKAVYDAIDAATHGNSIPAQPSACSQTGNTCALITNTEGSLQWVVMADDQHGGSVPSNN